MKETEFSVFASKLATYFQGERSPEEFTRTLFEKVYLNSKGDSLLHDMEARTLRGYFYGEHDIANVAKKISSDLDSAYLRSLSIPRRTIQSMVYVMILLKNVLV